MGVKWTEETGESNPITESQYSGISGSRFRENGSSGRTNHHNVDKR